MVPSSLVTTSLLGELQRDTALSRQPPPHHSILCRIPAATQALRLLAVALLLGQRLLVGGAVQLLPVQGGVGEGGLQANFLLITLSFATRPLGHCLLPPGQNSQECAAAQGLSQPACVSACTLVMGGNTAGAGQSWGRRPAVAI